MEDGFIVLQIQLDGRQTDRKTYSHSVTKKGVELEVQFNIIISGLNWLEDRQELVIGYQETGKGEFII